MDGNAFLARALEVSQWPQEMRKVEMNEIIAYARNKPLDALVPLNLAATVLGCAIGKSAHAHEIPTNAPVIHTVVLSDGVNVKEG